MYMCVCVPQRKRHGHWWMPLVVRWQTNELDSLQICSSPVHSKMGSSAIPFAAYHNDPTIPIHLVSFYFSWRQQQREKVGHNFHLRNVLARLLSLHSFSALSLSLSLSRLSKLCNTHKSSGNSHFILLKYVHTYIVIYIYTYIYGKLGAYPRKRRTNERADGHRFGVRAIGATFHLKAIHHNVCTVLYTVCRMLHGHCPHSPRLVGLDENWSSARARARQALGSASHRSAQVVHIVRSLGSDAAHLKLPKSLATDIPLKMLRKTTKK